VVTRQQLQREERRAAHGRALVVEPAPQQLRLPAEAELADRAERDRTLAEVGGARRSLELVVPLRAQLRERTLVTVVRERVGLRCCFRERQSESDRGGGPT
jgi:hypothetical protein